MKKLMIALSLAAVFSGSAFAEESLDISVPERAVDHNKVLVTQGNVTFNGEVIANTCSIKGDANKTIELKSVKNTDFLNSSEVEAGNFDITLENCSPNKERMVSLSFFAPQENVTDFGYLKNTVEDSFKSNVFVKLTYGDKLVDFKQRDGISDTSDSAEISIRQDIAADYIPFNFKVFYVKDGNNAVTSGKVAATAQYQIAYK